LDATAGGCPHPAASRPSRTRTALARSERPSERPAKAPAYRGRSGDAGHNEARGQAGGAIDRSLTTRRVKNGSNDLIDPPPKFSDKENFGGTKTQFFKIFFMVISW